MMEMWNISLMISAGVVYIASLGRAFPIEVLGSLLSHLFPGDCSPLSFHSLPCPPELGYILLKHLSPAGLPLPEEISRHCSQFSDPLPSGPLPLPLASHHNRNCDNFLLFRYKPVQQVKDIRWRLSYSSSFVSFRSHLATCEKLHIFLNICNSHNDSEVRCYYYCFDQVRQLRLTEFKHLSNSHKTSLQRSICRVPKSLPYIASFSRPSELLILSILMSSFTLFWSLSDLQSVSLNYIPSLSSKQSLINLTLIPAFMLLSN